MAGSILARTGLPLAVIVATYDAANELTEWRGGRFACDDYRVVTYFHVVKLFRIWYTGWALNVAGPSAARPSHRETNDSQRRGGWRPLRG
jgi:hypothetical protein